MQNRHASLQEWWSGFFDRFAHSYLVKAMVVVIFAFWGFNVWHLFTEYAERAETRVFEYQDRLLDHKREEFEDIFRAIYQHTRTVSLIPAIRSVTGGNRLGEFENAVNQGRLSVDTHDTLRQIYISLSRNVQVSEIYYVLDGFRPDLGEVPFLMFDNEIRKTDPLGGYGEVEHKDTPEEYEAAEYAYYLRQLDWFRARFPVWTSDNIDGIPAIMSPLMRTCDNTQYESLAGGNVRDTHGLLYSVPVYADVTGALKGLITAVVRANVLEAVLVGVPHLIVTDEDRRNADAAGWSMPADPSSFALTHEAYGIEIFDRRNADFAQGVDAAYRSLSGRWASTEVRMRTDGMVQVHHYLSPAQIDALTAPLRNERNNAIAARVLLLALLMLIFWRAIRDQRRHHAELVRLAHYDTLTALPNRRLFVQRLEQSIARGRRHHSNVGLMFLDVDNFGSINDTLGHQAGDELLAAVSQRLRETLRISDEVVLRNGIENATSLARVGGDDFTLIFEDLDRPEDAALVAERIRVAFSVPVEFAGQEMQVSLSAGITVFPDDAGSSADLMVCADHALRSARSAGSGEYRMYSDEMRRKAKRQGQLMHELPIAVREHQFFLVYQPKLDLRSREIVSFEALVRWVHPQLGFVSPVEFIPLLERSGQIVEVGRWILETACRQLLEWQREGRPDLRMSVNVSARQLLSSDMVATTFSVLDATGLSPRTLTLEITESMVIDNLKEGHSMLERLRALGVKIAIDDFGTGYSSLTYLQNLAVDCLKLDKSMIDTLLEARGAHVVRSTIALAHGLGLEIVAEGVETAEQMEALARMDCDLIQGYHFSKPLATTDAGALLLAHRAAAMA